MTEKEQAAREAELTRREAALAAREAQLEQEQAKLEAARAEAPKGRKTLLNNNDPDDNVHLVLGMTHTSFFGLFGG